MSVKIIKEIAFGSKYVEHVYQSYPESWNGTWVKVGHDVNNSPTTYDYLCAYCHFDCKNRTHLGNYLDSHY